MKYAMPYLYERDGRRLLLRCAASGDVDFTESLARKNTLFRGRKFEDPRFDKARADYLRSQRLTLTAPDWRVEIVDLETGAPSSATTGQTETHPYDLDDSLQRVVLGLEGQRLHLSGQQPTLRPPPATVTGFRRHSFQVWLCGETIVEWEAKGQPCAVTADVLRDIVRIAPVHGQPRHWIATTRDRRSFLWNGRELREIRVDDQPVGPCSILGDECAYETDDTITISPFQKGDALPVATAPYGRPMTSVAASFADALIRWSSNGWPMVESDVYDRRLATCRACPYWDEDAIFRVGRCNACRCTVIKHAMATESCPKGYWLSDLLARSIDGIFPWRNGGLIMCSTDVMFIDLDSPAYTENERLDLLRAYVKDHPVFGFRAYRTAGGLRYILTSHLHPIRDQDGLDTLFRDLAAEPNYLALAIKHGCWAARLTPKTRRIPKGLRAQDCAVTEFIGHFGNPEIEPRCAPLVAEHDVRTFRNGSPLA